MGVSENSVPHCTQWFSWSLSLWKMAISLRILTQHFQTNPNINQTWFQLYYIAIWLINPYMIGLVSIYQVDFPILGISSPIMMPFLGSPNSQTPYQAKAQAEKISSAKTQEATADTADSYATLGVPMVDQLDIVIWLVVWNIFTQQHKLMVNGMIKIVSNLWNS